MAVAWVSPLLATLAAIAWISYLVYVPWDAWWYLRFLLPAWPMVAAGTASLVMRTGRVAALLIVALGLFGAWTAVRRDAFALAESEARYVEVAKAVEATTPADAVIVSVQHSGSLRFYAGRMTLRWDFIDPRWLDRIVAALADGGHHPYFVLDAGEAASVRERFASHSSAGKLDWQPSVPFRYGTIELYDPLRRTRDVPMAQPATHALRECLPPRPFPMFR